MGKQFLIIFQTHDHIGLKEGYNLCFRFGEHVIDIARISYGIPVILDYGKVGKQFLLFYQHLGGTLIIGVHEYDDVIKVDINAIEKRFHEQGNICLLIAGRVYTKCNLIF